MDGFTVNRLASRNVEFFPGYIRAFAAGFSQNQLLNDPAWPKQRGPRLATGSGVNRVAAGLRPILAALLALLVAGLVTPAEARRRQRRLPRPVVRSVLVVVPQELIAARVALAVHQLLQPPETWLEDPFLVSALYYRDEFLQQYEGPDAARQIVSTLRQRMTAADRAQFLAVVAAQYREEWDALPQDAIVAPVPALPHAPRRRRPNHRDAVDLFVPEGTPVRAAAAGSTLR